MKFYRLTLQPRTRLKIRYRMREIARWEDVETPDQLITAAVYPTVSAGVRLPGVTVGSPRPWLLTHSARFRVQTVLSHRPRVSLYWISTTVTPHCRAAVCQQCVGNKVVTFSSIWTRGPS